MLTTDTVACLNPPSNFCYVCGTYTMKSERQSISNSVIDAYKSYFDCEIHQGKWWQPKSVCTSCYTNLLQWKKGIRKTIPFRSPMIWMQPKEHPNDCYLCQTRKVIGLTKSTKKFIEYPEVSSVRKPSSYIHKMDYVRYHQCHCHCHQHRRRAVRYLLKLCHNKLTHAPTKKVKRIHNVHFLL